MNLDLDLKLPEGEDSSFPPPRLDNTRYLEYIEFNQRVVRENGTAERIMRARSEPVDDEFVLV